MPSRTIRLVVLGALAATGSLATTAWTQDNSATERYSCRNGERFAVERHTDHVRLRTGAGIFTLTAVDANAGKVAYSDGSTILSGDRGAMRLERAGQPAADACLPDPARL